MKPSSNKKMIEPVHNLNMIRVKSGKRTILGVFLLRYGIGDFRSVQMSISLLQLLFFNKFRTILFTQNRIDDVFVSISSPVSMPYYASKVIFFFFFCLERISIRIPVIRQAS